VLSQPSCNAILCPCLQAFDVLEHLDPTQQLYEAKRGAAVGAFQMMVAGKEEVGPTCECHACCQLSGVFFGGGEVVTIR
jgi:hypothetical protein